MELKLHNASILHLFLWHTSYWYGRVRLMETFRFTVSLGVNQYFSMLILLIPDLLTSLCTVVFRSVMRNCKIAVGITNPRT